MKKYIATSAAALMLSTSSLYALNAQQVWMFTQPALVDAGFDLENAEITQTQDGIEIKNLDLDSDTPGEFFKIPQLNIKNVGDGVEIKVPKVIEGKASNGEEVMIDMSKMTLSAADVQGFTMIGPFTGKITGPLSLSFKETNPASDTASTMNMSLSELFIEIPPAQANGTSTAQIETGFAKMTYEGAMEYGTQGQFTSEYGPSKTSIEVSDVALFWTRMDPIAAISQGANVTIDIEQDAGQYAMRTTGKKTMNMAANWDAAQAMMELNRSGLSYDYDTNGMNMLVQGDGEEVPNLNFKMGQATGQIKIPLFANAQEQQANITTRIEDLVFSADGTQVPKEVQPFLGKTLNIDISAKAGLKITDDLWPTSMDDNIESRAPSAGQLTSVVLDKFFLSMGETSLNAQGAFNFTGENFENTAPENGEVVITATQILTLLKELAANGTIPPQEAGMAEMMLRGMAKPGEVDPLTYTIKLGQESITINGNPL